MQISQAQIDTIQPQWGSVEEILAWAAMLLHFGNPTLKVVEGENRTEFACQISIFTAEDGTERLISRMNLPLTPQFLSNGQKLWNSVGELSVQNIPSAYLS